MSDNWEPPSPGSSDEGRGSLSRVRFSQGGQNAESPSVPSSNSRRRISLPSWNIPDYQAPTDRRTSEAVPPNANNDTATGDLQPANDNPPIIQDKKSEKPQSSVDDVVPTLPELTFTPPVDAPQDTSKQENERQSMYGEEDLSAPIPGESGGLFSALFQRFGVDQYDFDRELEETHEDDQDGLLGRERLDSFLNENAQVLDPDDPTLAHDDQWMFDRRDDTEMNIQRDIAYHTRRKDRTKFRIEYNVCCEFPNRSLII